MRKFWLGIGTVFLGVWLASVAPARAADRTARLRTYALEFHRYPGAASFGVESDGRLAAIQLADGDVALVNQASGQTRVISPPGDCQSEQFNFAGSWLAGHCGPGGDGSPAHSYVENLYSIASGSWRSVNLPCSGDGDWGISGGTECSITAGSDWLAWTESCWNCGQTRGMVALNQKDARLSELPRTTPHTAIDLSSPTALARLCSPLTNRPGHSLVLDESAQFVVEDGGAPMNPYALAYNRTSSAYLEKCGTHLRIRLPPDVATGNSTEILFYPGVGAKVTGVFAASRLRFTFDLPDGLLEHRNPSISSLTLSSTRLYVATDTGAV